VVVERTPAPVTVTSKVTGELVSSASVRVGARVLRLRTVSSMMVRVEVGRVGKARMGATALDVTEKEREAVKAEEASGTVWVPSMLRKLPSLRERERVSVAVV